jgi:hypothetical protein
METPPLSGVREEYLSSFNGIAWNCRVARRIGRDALVGIAATPFTAPGHEAVD